MKAGKPVSVNWFKYHRAGLNWFNRNLKKASPKNSGKDIAVIGIACRLPDAKNYQEFWTNLEKGVNSIREISSDRWDINQYYSANNAIPNTSVSKWGGLLEQIDNFDAHFFHISPKEAEIMDPQQRILLEETWHCIEDAGIALKDLQEGNTSVFVGAMASDYHQYLVQLGHQISGYDCLGNYPSILANRISWYFNLSGESITLDAACASSLVSIHEARESLQSGESQLAFAAGVSVICHPWKYISFSKAHMLSPDGQCKTFDASANGYVPGEGAGVLLLETLSNALAKGHKIYGLIKGSSVHHGGKTNSITAPRLETQRKLVQETLKASRVSAESIGYIEAHGTGTSLGDPIEVEALTKAFSTSKKQYCLIGSVKSNIGHLEGAAGVAGVIKVLMMLRHKKIPKSLNINVLNPVIDFENSPFRVANQLQEWNLLPAETLRRAGVSSFGFGGVDAHLIVEEFSAQNHKKSVEPINYPMPFFLSAKSEQSLEALINLWQFFVKKEDYANFSLNSMIHIMTLTRQSFRYGWGTIIQSKRELAQQLSHAVPGDRQAALSKRTVVLCINPGEDVDYRAFSLCAENHPIMKQLEDQIQKVLLRFKKGREIIKNLPTAESPDYKNLRNFIVIYILGRALLKTGFQPVVLLGSGIGELVETVLAKILSLKDALATLVHEETSIMIHRPEIPLYEQHYNKMLTPFVVLKNYCHKLRNQVKIDRKTLKVLVEMAKILVVNQLTFRKFLLDWQAVFDQHEISLDNALTIRKKQKQTLLGLAILYCVKKLNKKWGFDEHVTIDNIAVHEVIDLLLDKVISYREIANLLIAGNNETKKDLAAVIQARISFLDPEKPYHLLKVLNQSISGIADIKLWLKQITEDKKAIKQIPDDSQSYWYIDISDSPSSDQSNRTLLNLNDLSNNLPEFLLNLWMLGIPIDWGAWYDFKSEPSSYSLPQYPFAQDKHWFSALNKEEERPNLSFAPVEEKPGKKESVKTEETGVYYYRSLWKEESLEQRSTPSSLLIIDEDEDLAKALKEKNPNLDLVYLSSHQKDYLNQLQGHRNIIYKMTLYQKEELTEPVIRYQIQKSFYALLDLLQAEMKSKIHQANLLVVNEVPPGKANLFTAALSSFMKTLQLENPGLACRLLHLPPTEDAAEKILQEFSMPNREVFYNYSRRCIRQFEEIKPKQSTDGVLKKNGVYLITGGAGGLGNLFSQYLARDYQAKLILIGRSELNEKQKTNIQSLEESGAQVRYLSIDISKSENINPLKQALAEIVASFGPIQGVFHAAGLIHDEFIIEKLPEDAEKVLAPKIFGTFVIDEVTKSEPLDFFVMFSSMVSIFGNVGQCDYAYANDFMDNFSEYRSKLRKNKQRNGKTISINWPLWLAGGMQINEIYRTGFLKKLGMVSLETKDGIKAFLNALQEDYSQFIVLSGYQDKINAALNDLETVRQLPQQETLKVSVKEEDLAEATTDLLKRILSEPLKISPEKIHPEEPFEFYGIDSLMIVNLNQALEKVFGEIPQTLFFEYLSLEELVNYFIKEHSETLIKLEQPEKITEEIIVESEVVQSKIQTSLESKNDEDIAIIGLSGRYPQAENLQIFWENLKQGKNNITEIPSWRWDYRAYFDPDKEKTGKTYSKWGGFIADADQFDPLFFNITPQEAIYMDPQERLFLEIAWSTIEDAGYTKAALANQQVGVFVGVMYDEYPYFGIEESLRGNTQATNPLHAYIANRVSYFFNFHGPSISLDTMCSSSLTTVHLACQAIKLGECQMAIAGGVNLNLHPNKYIFLSRGKFLASDGLCRSFGEGGDGYVPGEGVGAILLKPLSKALKEGDHIYGLIKGSSINHCGKTNGFTVPSPTAQAALIETAFNNAKIDPETISYIEAHGTGTALGDPIEISGLTKVFGRLNNLASIPIGSVKSNIGHLESAAGIAAISKVVLQMQHKSLVPSLHSKILNSNISWAKSPFIVQQNLSPWQTEKIPRRASISSFGAGGSNAHLIMEEAPEVQRETYKKSSYLLPLSAKSQKALAQKSKDLEVWLGAQQKDLDLASLSYTLQTGRQHFNHRAVYQVSTVNELQEALDAINQGSSTIYYHSAGPKELKESLTQEANKIITELLEEESEEEYRKLLTRLANLYLEQTFIDWQRLYQDKRMQKMSLPTYPFEKKSYWITETPVSTQPNSKLPPKHPFLDYSLPNHVYSKELKKEDFYIKDHVVLGKLLLPGTAYLEWARAAGSFEPNKEVRLIKSVIWQRPLIVDQEPIKAFVQLTAGSGFKIYQHESQSCSEGKLGYDPPPPQQRLDLEAIRARCSFMLNKDEIYQHLTEMGFNYGPAFQVSQNAYINDEEVLVALKLPDFLQEGAKEFTLHPSLMDGALRATFGHDYLDKAKTGLKVPFSLDSLSIYQPVNSDCWAYAKTIDKAANIFDLRITDSQGEVLVSMHRFMTRPMKMPIKNESTTILYKPEWLPAPRKPSGSMNKKVVFANDHYPLPEAIWVRPGSAYQKNSATEYSIRPDSLEDYQLLFKDLKQQAVDYSNILHLWSSSEEQAPGNPTLGLNSLVCLCHAIEEMQELRLLFIFASQRVDSCPYHEAVAGFMHTLKILKPGWVMNLLQMDQLNFNLIQEEFAEPEEKTEIRYQQGERYLRVFKELVHQNKGKPGSFRKGGVYLITGGLGGIGRLFAENLAVHYNAKLILVGRRALTSEIQKMIQEIEQKGAEVLYLSADISKSEEVERVYKTIKEKWSMLHGILHAAGVFPERSFFQMPLDDFYHALAPKTLGTLNLDRVTAKEALDYFIVFSSISSELGDYGSASYATGNRFMDAYINFRERLVQQGERQGKSLSINWPYWQEGGMHLSEEEAKVYFDYLGMSAIDNAKGLELFYQIIGLHEAQILVMAGNREKMEKALGKSKTMDQRPTVQTVDLPQAQEGSDLQAKTENYLKEILFSITKIPVEDIDSKIALEEYGIDSVMILKFNSALSKNFSKLRNTLLFEYRTLSDLANYFIEEKREELAKVIGLSVENSVEPKQEALKPSIVSSKSGDIAVIGLSGRFPQAYDLNSFWENLKEGRDCIEEIPKKRWDFEAFYYPDGIQPGKTISKWGGFIEDIDQFDPLFFNISAREAEQMDPQERLFLEIVWATLEDSGYTPKSLHESSEGRVSVFVGVMWNEYQLLHGDQISSLFASNNSALANRISWMLDLHGPSVVLDTACSSSLVAIHQACETLLRGECKYAIAGGVNLSLTPQKYITLSQLGMLSRQGRCRSFGDGSDGYVPGEGVGAVLLKPLDKAVLDKDRIYAVIKGSSMNHGGKTNGYTVPNPDAQARLIQAALKKANIRPNTLSYVEAHGTGTPLGDPIEITGLVKAFGPEVPKQSCALGSVKSNIGHLEGAAGISAFSKVVLQLKNKELVPSLHAKALNPNIDFSDTPFYVQQSLTPWVSQSSEPLRAGISSFGAGGTNAHLILEAWEPVMTANGKTKPYYMVTLSAKTENALNEKKSDLRAWLTEPKNASVSLADMAYTLHLGRVHFDYRLAFIVNSLADLQTQLQDTLKISSFNKKELTARSNEFQSLSKVLLEKLASQSISAEDYRNSLQELANLYLQGFDPEWNLLYVEEDRQKIALPTYPFAKETYWLSEGSAAVPAPIQTSGELAEKLVDYLITKIAEVTKINKARIDPEANFEAFGIDSMTIIRLNETLEAQFGKLPATLFFSYHTIEELAGYLMKEHAENLENLFHLRREEAKLHQTIEPLQPQQISENQDIAVIGYFGQFPMAPSPVAFWENLVAARNCIVEIPKSRWDYKKYYQEIKSKADIISGKIYCKWGGFLDAIDCFDAELFHISPKEAIFMDPQERLFLQSVWSAIEAAGYIPEQLVDKKSGEQVSVFVGVSFNNYQLTCAEAMKEKQLAAVVDSQIFSVANRVSYVFDFKGPSIPLDTACSSSLYAIHLACESLKRGESAVAIAGATNLTIHPSKYATLCDGGFLASDGLCHAFGEGGDGYVPGEGVGALLLKPVDKARKDGDFIYGLIKGTALSQDGKTNGYTVPNPIAQAQAIETALAKAKIDARTVSYIEAHGTGTPLGDPVEVSALSEVFEKNNSDKRYCSLGSVKTNIGHLESAAGMAQIIKVLLQMSNHTLVPNLLHGQRLNTKIDFENSPFYVQQELEAWNSPFPRRAGLSSFGAGGTNSHVILEEYDNKINELKNPLLTLIVLSAPSEEQLKAYAESLVAFLKDYRENNPVTGQPIRIEDLAYTLQIGRVAFDHRLAFQASQMEELIDKLETYINGKQSASIWSAQVSEAGVPPKTDPSIETNPDRLGQLWVKGHRILWQNAYSEKAAQRIYLPTHVFKKTRFWVKASEAEEELSENPSPVPELEETVSIESQPKAKDTVFMQELSTSSETEKLKKMMHYCQKKLGELLEYESGKLPDPDKGFFDLGMESLLAMKLHHYFEEQLGIEIPDTAMFNYPTIRHIAKYFLELISANPEKQDELPEDIASLSEEEVIASLNALLPEKPDF